jgi:hypothetical protein
MSDNKRGGQSVCSCAEAAAMHIFFCSNMNAVQMTVGANSGKTVFPEMCFKVKVNYSNSVKYQSSFRIPFECEGISVY